MKMNVVAAALLIATTPVGAQTDAARDSQTVTTVRQKRLSVADVLGGQVKQSKDDRDALKEKKRHDKAMEKALGKLHFDERFKLGAQAGRQPARVHSLPAGSTRY